MIADERYHWLMERGVALTDQLQAEGISPTEAVIMLGGCINCALLSIPPERRVLHLNAHIQTTLTMALLDEPSDGSTMQ